MSFQSLKRNSNSLEKLNKEIEKINKPNENQSDENFWKPEVDKAGNGYAVIRFLPSPPADGDDGLPWVKMFSHGFEGPGGWYIENSLTTLNQKDPVSEHNSELWNSGIDANKEIARKQKRRLSYISNVYVVEDPAHPENNGKVFLYKYGKIIFDKVSGAMHPEFKDETPINPFDLWAGANFKIKIRKVDGFQNYDKSEFDSPAPLLDDDKALETIWNQEYSLLDLISEKNFKSYDQLKGRLDKVLGLNGSVPKTTVEQAKAQPREAVREDEPFETTDKIPEINEDDDLALFASLVNED
jgi:hypothetical protein